MELSQESVRRRIEFGKGQETVLAHSSACLLFGVKN
jgi:hypothetical protein